MDTIAFCILNDKHKRHQSITSQGMILVVIAWKHTYKIKGKYDRIISKHFLGRPSHEILVGALLCIHGSKLFIHSTHCIQQVYGTHWELSTTIKQDGTSWTLKLEHPSNKYLFCFKSRPDLKVSYTKKFSSLSFDTNFVTNCRLRIPNKSHQKSLSVLLNVL